MACFMQQLRSVFEKEENDGAQFTCAVQSAVDGSTRRLRELNLRGTDLFEQFLLLGQLLSF